MPIVSFATSDPFVDGRQSDRALQIRTGVESRYHDMGWACLPEVTLKHGRRADLVALSPKGVIHIVEVKSSIADMRADNKWPDYRSFCDQLFFATLADVPKDIFPSDCGFLVADQFGAELLREAPIHKMAAATRRELTVRLARSAAMRLSRCCAHAGLDGAQFSD